MKEAREAKVAPEAARTRGQLEPVVLAVMVEASSNPTIGMPAGEDQAVRVVPVVILTRLTAAQGEIAATAGTERCGAREERQVNQGLAAKAIRRARYRDMTVLRARRETMDTPGKWLQQGYNHLSSSPPRFRLLYKTRWAGWLSEH